MCHKEYLASSQLRVESAHPEGWSSLKCIWSLDMSTESSGQKPAKGKRND